MYKVVLVSGARPRYIFMQAISLSLLVQALHGVCFLIIFLAGSVHVWPQGFWLIALGFGLWLLDMLIRVGIVTYNSKRYNAVLTVLPANIVRITVRAKGSTPFKVFR